MRRRFSQLTNHNPAMRVCLPPLQGEGRVGMGLYRNLEKPIPLLASPLKGEELKAIVQEKNPCKYHLCPCR
jgi:hypothetical protein